MSWPHPQQRLNISETLKMVLCVTMVYNYYPFTTQIRPIRQAAINVHVNDFDYSSLLFVNTTCPYRKKLNICFSWNRFDQCIGQTYFNTSICKDQYKSHRIHLCMKLAIFLSIGIFWAKDTVHLCILPVCGFMDWCVHVWICCMYLGISVNVLEIILFRLYCLNCIAFIIKLGQTLFTEHTFMHLCIRQQFLLQC